ncbi:MAG: riboflavin synthase [Nevskia sp.]|nr:riboflavin synthase [Nevskia sp.]
MFTGIVESLGRIEAIETVGGDRRLTVLADGSYLDGLQHGDSVAVSGVCLTAVTLLPRGFTADVSVETLNATTAGRWQAGTPVNLERALTPAKPLGGHLMSGHVDGVGRLVELRQEARSRRLVFEPPRGIARYIARKGSVAIDGVSLTVNEVEPLHRGGRFGVNIIPQTWTHTTLGGLAEGAQVNLEVDLIARYLERLLSARDGRGADQEGEEAPA